METEKNINVFECIKNDDDKSHIHTELVKSGNEGIFNIAGKSEVVIEQVDVRNENN